LSIHNNELGMGSWGPAWGINGMNFQLGIERIRFAGRFSLVSNKKGGLLETAFSA
jgi:hypothetical protein